MKNDLAQFKNNLIIATQAAADTVNAVAEKNIIPGEEARALLVSLSKFKMKVETFDDEKLLDLQALQKETGVSDKYFILNYCKL